MVKKGVKKRKPSLGRASSSFGSRIKNLLHRKSSDAEAKKTSAKANAKNAPAKKQPKQLAKPLPIKQRILKYLDFAFKFSLLLIAIADLAGLLPSSLDFFDKAITGILMFYFWDKLDLTKFMFGRDIEWMDKAVLAGFYIFVIDTYIRLIQVMDLSSSFVQSVNRYVGYIPWADYIRQGFMYLYNVNNNPAISLFSAYAGFIILLFCAIYLALFVEYREGSVFYSMTFLFFRKKWDDLAPGIKERRGTGAKGYLMLAAKLVLSAVIIFSISQYFFNLVNQWLVVSLDKSLFIVGFLYIVKDIHGSKSKVMNRLGSMDDALLGTITKVFTTPGKFYLGFIFLLIIHYLSDLSLFFIPLFFKSFSIDPYYLSRLPGPHTPIIDLLRSEAVLGVFNQISVYAVYLISAIGAVLIIAIPIIFFLLALLNKRFKQAITNKWYYILLALSFVSIFAFVLGPWVRPVSIFGKGIVGVDFVTNAISSSPLPITAIFLVIILSVILCIAMFRSRLGNYLALVVFLTGFYFFGKYVLNYFVSTLFYHNSTIIDFWKTDKFLSIMFFMLLLIETLFYVFGFLIAVFFASRYLIRELIYDFLTDKTLYAWTIIMFLVPTLILFISPGAISSMLIITLIFFIFTYAMYYELTGEEKRDDYILGVAMAIAVYEFIGLFIVFFSRIMSSLSETGINIGVNVSEDTIYAFSEFLTPLLIAAFTIYLLHYFGFRVRKSFSLKLSIRPLAIAAGAGVLFGLWFYLINEPHAMFLTGIFSRNFFFIALVLLALVIAIAEEFLFRGLIFKLAKQAFTPRAALVLQSIVFALMHFANSPRFTWNYFAAAEIRLFGTAVAPFGIPVFFFVYFLSLLLFAYICGLLVNRTKNLTYPIILHWIVNVIVFAFLFF